MSDCAWSFLFDQVIILGFTGLLLSHASFVSSNPSKVISASELAFVGSQTFDSSSPEYSFSVLSDRFSHDFCDNPR
ncbi:MAG: hypothetical protein ACW97Z_05865 [Candidatus Hodarchaeales archaeon]